MATVTVDADRVRQIRAAQQVSLPAAVRIARHEALVRVITDAKTIDDLRPALLALAELATAPS